MRDAIDADELAHHYAEFAGRARALIESVIANRGLASPAILLELERLLRDDDKFYEEEDE